MSKQINGISASEGIAIAKALVLKEEKIIIKKNKVIDLTAEIKKFNEAVTKTIADLENFKKITLKKMGNKKAEIFEAHKDIAADPAIKEEIISLIKNEHVCAEYATQTITNNYYETFVNMDNVYFKERSTDIKDVANRIIRHILNISILNLSTINEEVIIVANDLTPSQTAQLNKEFIKGFATNIGGKTSHSAIMARSLEIPAVLGLKTVTNDVQNGDLIALNGTTGILELSLTKEVKEKYQKLAKQFDDLKTKLIKYKNLLSLTADGQSKLIEGNISSINDVSSVIENGGQGIGLFRSEFLYMDNDHFPTEDEQYKAYKQVINNMQNHLVVIRTLDIGGDKKLSYFKFPHEINPFLGYRAVRFTLDRQDIFKTQLRALLRASVYGKIGIMFPMIATVDEFKRAKALVELCKTELSKEQIKYDKKIQVGMMVEIPAAAVNADKFSKYTDFFSIGTNDLIQYSMAADRMNENVSYLYQPLNPAILKLIDLTIKGAHKNNKWVGMCGEMASDIQALPVLLGLGLDAFSMNATSILRIRALMHKINMPEAIDLARKALACNDTPEVIKIVDTFLASLA